MKQDSLLRATSAVKPSSADFISLAENLPQLVWMADASGWVFWYNRRWYEYTGTTPAEMGGWGWQSVHDPGVLPSVLERWQQASLLHGSGGWRPEMAGVGGRPLL